MKRRVKYMTDGRSAAIRDSDEAWAVLWQKSDMFEIIFKVTDWAKISSERNVVERGDFWIYINPQYANEITDKQFKSVEEFVDLVNRVLMVKCEWTLYSDDEGNWFSICVLPDVSHPIPPEPEDPIVDEE